jgi:hypothetical protein
MSTSPPHFDSPRHDDQRLAHSVSSPAAHWSFGFRAAENFIAAIYHCSARLPLPVER